MTSERELWMCCDQKMVRTDWLSLGYVTYLCRKCRRQVKQSLLPGFEDADAGVDGAGVGVPGQAGGEGDGTSS